MTDRDDIERTVTRMRVRFDFVIEVDGIVDIPDEFGPSYKLTIARMLHMLKFNLPVRLLGDAKGRCDITDRARHVKRARGRPFLFVGASWTDHERGKPAPKPLTIRAYDGTDESDKLQARAERAEAKLARIRERLDRNHVHTSAQLRELLEEP